MQRISLKKATPGMRLAQPACRPDGCVLAKEGIALSQNIIDRFLSAGVSTIWIEGSPAGGGDIAVLQAITDNLPYIFRRQNGDVFMTTLRNVVARHMARRIEALRVLEQGAQDRARERALEEAVAKKAGGEA